MIGNPINFDKKYFSKNRLWNKPNLDVHIKRYLKLLKGKNVLDLGIGEGHNSIVLSELGYHVTGVDYSKKALEICKNNCSNSIDLIQSDIRDYTIQANKYDLIMSRNTLHFLHKKDALHIIDDIKLKLKKNGLVYISVFSTDEPTLQFKRSHPDFKALENNVFFRLSNNTYSSYFSKNEILEIFSNFTTISIIDEYSLDIEHGKPHYHGLIKYIGKK